MDSFYDVMKNQCMTISKYDDTHITASVIANDDRVLFTTIPYEKGWSITVDGTKVETFAFKDAFLAFKLEEGTHQIEFQYTPYGLKVGIGISFISLLIFCYLIYHKRKYNRAFRLGKLQEN